MKYPKIQTLWKRDENKKFIIMEGEYSKEEFKSIDRWEVTEKVDGTNIRVMWDGENVRFGGRTDNAQIPTFLLEYLQDKFRPELLENIISPDTILFGEGYGNRIQKVGKKYKDKCSFILFDVMIGKWWLERDDVNDIAKQLGIDSVPVIGIMTKEEIVNYVKSRPKSIIAQEELTMEGIVARSNPLMLFRNGKPIIFKLKVSDYDKLNEGD